MTFEERIEALTERNEALSQTVELITIERRELAKTTADNSNFINQLATIAQQTHESIAGLVRTAEAHERRKDGRDEHRAQDELIEKSRN